ncbi:hydroxypyruvate isomerase [Herbaspirillum sp. BH-1]|uniref:Hydroxypyruvate isomerase n=1 Tax=Herbaspirillum frisingense TaxID=92645 RepID=A0ABU1PD42_9BURK|nr:MULTISPECIES: hydroxypyruvate isomerase [Herbaspirillum]MDR6583841.1 hydroxypyruvate isomerase [Herbaspirillum frisingense]PLY58801.1 hydroxypyruvate isomerase [Herbaspirillum sp. BH-1]
MTRLAANLTMLFTEQPFLERFKAAADAGFKGVEFLFPYAFAPQQIADQLRTHRLQLVLHNLPAGNWDAGERGIACHPDRVAEFRAGVDEAIRYAKALEVPQLNCLVGILPPGVAREAAREVLVGNLKYAASKLKEQGIRLLIEPINHFDIPGFFLNTTRQAVELILATGSDNLFVQYDIYHMQRMEGELANTLKANLSLIGHVQLADNPGRGEPGSGEINYRYLFGWLQEIGYRGWIGCEYKPQAGTVAGLGWMAQHGLQHA